MDLQISPETVPKDHFKLVYIIFYCFGIVTLLPWNMFITVAAYWDLKFRTVSTSVQEPYATQTNVTDGQEPIIFSCHGECPNDLQKAWGGYLAVANMVHFVIFLTLNSVIGHHFRALPRLLTSLILNIFSFSFTTAMVKVDTDAWQSTFLYLTLASVSFIMVNSAIFEGGIFGVAGKFPPAYMGAVFSGQAVGGVLVSGTNVLILALGASAEQSAFICFLISVIFLSAALLSFALVTRMEFYQHYLGENSPAIAILETKPETATLLQTPNVPVSILKAKDDHDAPIEPLSQVSPLRVLLQILPYALAVHLVFLVTLSVFPAVSMQVVSTADPGTVWATKFYVPVACFLLFNIGDYIGRILAELIAWPRPSATGSYVTLALSSARLLFIPLFLCCNVRPGDRSITPVVFESDVIYMLIMAVFSLSNGYISSICMVAAPQVVRPEEAQTAAALMAALLGWGLALGAAASNALVLLI